MRFYFHDSRCVKFCHHFRIEILTNKFNNMAVGLISYQTLSCRLLNRMISHQSVSTICSFTRALSRRTSSPYTDLSPRTVHGLVGYTWLTTLKTRIKCVYRLKRGMTNSLKTDIIVPIHHVNILCVLMHCTGKSMRALDVPDITVVVFLRLKIILVFTSTAPFW